MKKILFIIFVVTSSLFAKLHIATTYNYLGAVTKEIAGNLASVDVLANPKLDPHFITPKPSLIGKLRREDLLIINGGQLEIGWLPPLLKSANNAKINVGGEGFLDVSGAVEMIDKPKSITRAYGDIHPDGNPHFVIDIHNILPIAKLISMKLSLLDPSNRSTYEANYQKFNSKIKVLINRFSKEGCKDKKVIQYHQLFNYAIKANGLESIGTIEPLPGIPPSSKHTIELIKKMKDLGVKRILQDVYHEKKTAQFIADKTGARVYIVPHDVGSLPSTDTLEKFYTVVHQRLCQ